MPHPATAPATNGRAMPSFGAGASDGQQARSWQALDVAGIMTRTPGAGSFSLALVSSRLVAHHCDHRRPHPRPGPALALLPTPAAPLRRRRSLLPPGAPVRANMEQALAALQERGQPLPAALRILRQLVMERLIVLDCEPRRRWPPSPGNDRAGRAGAGRACTRPAPSWTPPRRTPGPDGQPVSCGSSAWASWARASSTSPATST
jgi:hypothetical protein